MSATRISLDNTDFRDLVKGKIVRKFEGALEVQIALQDIGFSEIAAAVAEAQGPTVQEQRVRSYENLDGVFGVCEMECAALRLIQLCREKGTWLVPVGYANMRDAQSEGRGFIQLIYRGLLQCGYYKDYFYATQEFINLVKSRAKQHVLGDLPLTAPTYENIIESMMASWKLPIEIGSR